MEDYGIPKHGSFLAGKLDRGSYLDGSLNLYATRMIHSIVLNANPKWSLFIDPSIAYMNRAQ